MARPLRGGVGGKGPGHKEEKITFFGTFFPTFNVPTAIKLEGGGEWEWECVRP